jgi:PNKP (polynucleotide 5'-kinase/3'-phosphatase) family adenylyltransferase-like protein
VTTRLHHNITVREENALAALEVMSRFAANPKWLIYLPPTMSPTETTEKPGLLEHPAEAFAYFRREGVPRVVCEEKHMGSRAVVIVCRNEDAARRRFGVIGEGIGICYTRTGRRFFDDAKIEKEFLEKVRGAVDAEYLLPEELERLRGRSVSTKRSLALREFALGIEALERFVRQEPLRHVHECVFGVLALESEPVDPRL